MKLTNFDLKNKFALITGSAGLLGEEHALALLEVNANIVLTDINKERVHLIRKRLIKFYPSKKIVSYPMDVTDPNSIKNVLNSLNLPREHRISPLNIKFYLNYTTTEESTDRINIL